MNSIEPGRLPAATRNRYFRGKRIKAEDYAREHDYESGRRRLVNRAVLGHGVVYGFALPSAPAEGAAEWPVLAVGPGFALDLCGREVVTHDLWTLDGRNTFLMPKDGGRGCPGDLKLDRPGRYLLRVHYAEIQDVFTRVGDGCGCEPAEANLIHETAAFSLEWWDEACAPDACGCPGEGACEGSGGRGCGGAQDFCDNLDAWTATAPAHRHAGLCPWRDRAVALADGVPLGLLEIRAPTDLCDPLRARVLPAGHLRPIVKNNQLLYDLLPRCLTRIVDVSWRQHHRAAEPIAWETFQRLIIPDPPRPDRATDLAFTFSGPVNPATVRPDAVAITVMIPDGDSHWDKVRRVRITGILQDANDPRTFRIKVARRWIRDEIETDSSSEFHFGDDDVALVEIAIRGDLIEDLSGRAIDAEPRGRSGVPSGNGAPGGLFLSCFRVIGRNRRKSRGSDEAESEPDQQPQPPAPSVPAAS